VGDYIASEAVLRVCREPAPLLDINIVRVLRRVFGVEPSKGNPYEDSALLGIAKELTPRDSAEAEELAYGVMDLARKVCKARSPLCAECLSQLFRVSYRFIWVYVKVFTLLL